MEAASADWNYVASMALDPSRRREIIQANRAHKARRAPQFKWISALSGEA
jgi:hypothetical protein